VPVSNQQPPYGQPQQPYGQQPPVQPPYGQPQYGGYPPPPPPPSGSNKTILIVFTVVVAMVVLGAGIFVVSRFAGGSDDSAGTTPVASQSTSVAPSDGGSPTEPANDTSPSAPASTSSAPAQPCSGCMPGITVNGSLKALKAKGYACKNDGVLGIRCAKGKLEVTVHPDYTNKAYVERINVSGSAGVQAKDCPQCPKAAVAVLRQGLPTVLPLFVPDASIRKQLITFAEQGIGLPNTGPSGVKSLTIPELYRASTHGYEGATVGKDGRYGTSYSTTLYVDGY
jgi:hypothetical protein